MEKETSMSGLDTAPRDGRPFLFIYDDGSGAHIVCCCDKIDGSGPAFYDIGDFSDPVAELDDPGFWLLLPMHIETMAKQWIDSAPVGEASVMDVSADYTDDEAEARFHLVQQLYTLLDAGLGKRDAMELVILIERLVDLRLAVKSRAKD
jgi:hypothetical protein